MDAHENTEHQAQTTTTQGPEPVTPAGTGTVSSRRPSRRTWGFVAAMAVVTTGTVVAATVITPASSSADATSQHVTQVTPGYGYGGSFGGYGYSGGGSGYGGGSSSGGSSGSSGAGSTTTTTGPVATTAQQVGVVTIVSTLGYEDGEAAGTGMVLTSRGEVLTNNHVVEGSTSIEVTVESTGEEYTATVVGTDATDDVAVLQLQDASGLATVKTDTATPGVGAAVTAVGNAGGTGTLTTATGSITATGQHITTQAEGSAASESLSGLLQTDADIQSGDSGGPLLDADGEVVGIDTAASSGTTDVTGFAIPIATALTIASQITSGQASSTVTIGLPAFLGVQLSSLQAPTSDGALLAGVEDGTPAAEAGLATGDTITAVGGTAVTSADALSTALATHAPGDHVSITWLDSSGASHTATVTLAQGPAA